MGELVGLDVNLVVVLDAVLRERNLTRAGEAVGVTQSAISNSLNKLRKLLDDPLLVRTGRQFELTPRAQEILPLVREAMQQIDRTLNVYPTFEASESTRRFYITASDYTLSTLTRPLLGVLKEHAPKTSIEFSALPPIDTGVSPVDLLRFDVVIGAGGGIPGKHQSLYSDDFVCVAAKGNARLRDGQLSLKDLGDLQHVVTPHPTQVVSLDPAMRLSELGVLPKSAMTVVGFGAVCLLVSGTQYVGFVPRRLAESRLDDLDLVIAETPLPPSLLVEAAYWHPSKTNDPAIRWLLGMLRTAAERLEFDGYEEHSTAAVTGSSG